MKLYNDTEKETVKALINEIIKNIKLEKPDASKVDSNLFHFIIYDVNRRCELGLTFGWFKHGPYSQAVDDALIELGLMDKDQHQIYGKEIMMEKMIE